MNGIGESFDVFQSESGQANQGISSSAGISTNQQPNTVPIDWRLFITPDIRNHLVHRIAQTLFPSPDPSALQDKRMADLFAYARKVERNIYEVAADRAEYYNLLYKKICKLQRELEERKQRRKEQLDLQKNSCPT